MTAYTLGSLFSGIGGIDLAFQYAGFEIGFQVEIDDYCNRVLTRHWPDVPKFRDVRECGADNLPYCDVLAGGFPCQDISLAGNGAGIRAGTRSGLWFEFARIIGDLRPRVVLLENVSAITSRDGTIVLGNLAEMGYDAQWGTLRASDAGAPHQRERWFCVAYAGYTQRRENNTRGWRMARAANSLQTGREKGPGKLAECGYTLADPAKSGLERQKRTNAHSGARPTQSRLGRDADGLSYRLDAPRWPAEPGQPQHTWEPPRTTEEKTHRTQRLKALGNAVVPQVVYPLACAIKATLEAQDGKVTP